MRSSGSEGAPSENVAQRVEGRAEIALDYLIGQHTNADSSQ